MTGPLPNVPTTANCFHELDAGNHLLHSTILRAAILHPAIGSLDRISEEARHGRGAGKLSKSGPVQSAGLRGSFWSSVAAS